MNKQLNFHDKAININLSERAIQQNIKLDETLLIEIQIYFSCLLGKRLAFYSDAALPGTWQVEDKELFNSMKNDAQQLTDKIYIRFNTVMTKSCPVSDYVGPPPVTDFTISNQKPYVPSWLNINFKGGEWCGEYGWPVSKPGQTNTKQVRGQARRTEAVT